MLVSGGLALSLLPGIAFAHEGNLGLKTDLGAHIGTAFSWGENGMLGFMWHRSKSGSVTAKSSNGFTLTAKDGTVYTVTVDGDTKISRPFNGMIALADIAVNDSATVKGTVNGTQIAAKYVVVTPQNTHAAKARGSVTAVNGSVITIQGNDHGIPYNVTVNTNADTTVKGTSTATSTVADIHVGSKITVKGLWDEILNVLNAIKIRIWK